MEATKESLLERYSQMEAAGLVELQRISDLTEVALGALEVVLFERGITVGDKTALTEQLQQESERLVPLASIGSRIVAQVIDGLFGLALLLVPLAIFALLSQAEAGFLIGVIVFLAYLLFQDALPNGQSIGKRFMEIAVVNKTSGKAYKWTEFVVRNTSLVVLGIFDLLSLGSRYQQRLGEWLANTIVITCDRNKDD